MATLTEQAKNARERSYSPYSHRKVGAAIATTDGKTYTGCNVENSSFGATVCAERVAIQTAVATQGKFTLQEVAVVTDSDPAWTPCGMCRQVMVEFGTPDTRITCMNLQGKSREFKLKDLLPEAFTPRQMGV